MGAPEFVIFQIWGKEYCPNCANMYVKNIHHLVTWGAGKAGATRISHSPAGINQHSTAKVNVAMLICTTWGLGPSFMSAKAKAEFERPCAGIQMRMPRATFPKTAFKPYKSLQQLVKEEYRLDTTLLPGDHLWALLYNLHLLWKTLKCLKSLKSICQLKRVGSRGFCTKNCTSCPQHAGFSQTEFGKVTKSPSVTPLNTAVPKSEAGGTASCTPQSSHWRTVLLCTWN